MKLTTRSPLLSFGPSGKKLRKDLSVAVMVDSDLWVASDEGFNVERLSTKNGAVFENHRSFSLKEILDLPVLAPPDADMEIDIEGIAHQGDYLWIVGSHSIKREKVEADDELSREERIKLLAVTRREGNRHMLARIPLVKNGATGEAELIKSKAGDSGAGASLSAAQLPATPVSNALTELLAKDPHLADSLSVPGKENGFDIEGLAIAGERIFIGLRGPVLRGWAVVLEIAVEQSGPSLLKLREVSDGKLYKKHFLQLSGLGIRELCVHASDLLLLAGPTLDIDGPVRVVRWKGALEVDAESVVFEDKLTDHVDVPFGRGKDHAEGVTLVQMVDDREALLIVYDSPDKPRLVGNNGVWADIIDLP